MILSHIVAVSKNRVIGRANNLPWHIPEDLRYFKKTTKGHIIIMGRKTFESIGKRALPGRLNIVISRRQNYEVPPGVALFSKVEEAIAFAKKECKHWGEEIFICGGGEIYQQTLSVVNKIYLTEVDITISDGEVFYPDVDEREFQLVSDSPMSSEINYNFKVFHRLI